MVPLMLMLAAAAGSVGNEPPPDASRRGPEVQGHRGARSARPENTLAAFRYAIGVGVDVLELDLAITKDEQFVVIHDLFLNPDLCLAPGGERIVGRIPVRSLSLEELRAYDCGTLRNPRFPEQIPVPGERIPTLEEVFRLVEGTEGAAEVRLNIEAKSIPSRPDLTLPPLLWAEKLAKALSHPARRRRVTVQSFDHRILKALKEARPDVKISALVAKSLPDLVELARDLGAGIVSPNLDWITGPVVEALHVAGVRVIPWTANTEDEWVRLLEHGADVVNTDDPVGLIAFLQARGLR